MSFTADQLDAAGRYSAWAAFGAAYADPLGVTRVRDILARDTAPKRPDHRAITSRHECTSCGSHEHVRHNGQTVCTYCRSAV